MELNKLMFISVELLVWKIKKLAIVIEKIYKEGKCQEI